MSIGPSALVATAYITKARTALALIARSFLTYLAKPRLNLEPKATIPLSRWAIGSCLFVLSLASTAMFGVMALPFIMLADAGPGEHLQRVVTQSMPSVVLTVIVLGPLIEEVLFRGWLSGAWRAVAGSAAFLAIMFGGALPATKLAGGATAVIQIGLAIVGLIVLRLLSPIDGGKRLPGFERMFPYLFWAQGLVFGALHFKNVAASSSIIAILSVLPLVMCAWLWGYARLTIGLGSAVILHAAYNVPAVLGTIALMTSRQG